MEKVREKDMSYNKKTIKISHHTVCFSEVKEYFNTHKGIHRFWIPKKKTTDQLNSYTFKHFKKKTLLQYEGEKN